MKTSVRCLLTLGVWLATGHPAAAQPVYQVLHSFPAGPSDGTSPVARSLINGPDGTLYGLTTAGGGSGCGGSGCGTVFGMAPDGSRYTVLYAFTGGTTDGNGPSALIQGSDGNLFGTTRYGGGSGCAGLGCGTIFQLAADGSRYTVLYAFTGGTTDAAWPTALIQAVDGNLYGSTQLGGSGYQCGPDGCGTVFKIATDGAGYSIGYSFDGFGGAGGRPYALIQADDLNFYGYAKGPGGGCGDNNCDIVFQLTRDFSRFTILLKFTQLVDVSVYPAALIQGGDSKLYGTTLSGISCFDCGTVFGLATDGTGYAVLHQFTRGSDGSSPVALAQGVGGPLYGTIAYGGSGFGAIFRVAWDGTGYAVVYALTGVDGQFPNGLDETDDGTFYGTTAAGGAGGAGVVFRLTP